MRDMTGAQFLEALKRHGMTRTGFMGYVEIGHGHGVSRFNAGRNLRRQLAWLLQEQEKVEDRAERGECRCSDCSQKRKGAA